MLRFVLVFLAGVPVGWAMIFSSLTDMDAIIACLVASGFTLIAAWNAPDHSKQEKALEKHLGRLRIVGREEER